MAKYIGIFQQLPEPIAPIIYLGARVQSERIGYIQKIYFLKCNGEQFGPVAEFMSSLYSAVFAAPFRFISDGLYFALKFKH